MVTRSCQRYSVLLLSVVLVSVATRVASDDTGSVLASGLAIPVLGSGLDRILHTQRRV